MERETSIAIIKKQILESASLFQSLNLEFSSIDEENLIFTVRFTAKDDETYLLSVQFDNYPQWPPFLEFIDEDNGAAGVVQAYPASTDSFFNRYNNQPVICHPCSRKAYKELNGIHKDWDDYTAWQVNEKTGTIKNLTGILLAIYSRLNGTTYNGRMKNV